MHADAANQRAVLHRVVVEKADREPTHARGLSLHVSDEAFAGITGTDNQRAKPTGTPLASFDDAPHCQARPTGEDDRCQPFRQVHRKRDLPGEDGQVEEQGDYRRSGRREDELLQIEESGIAPNAIEETRDQEPRRAQQQQHGRCLHSATRGAEERLFRTNVDGERERCGPESGMYGDD